MKVLVTGALGNVGSNVTLELLRQGHQVTCFDLETPANVKKAKQVDHKVEIQWGNLTDRASVERAVKGHDVVMHIAGILPPLSEAKPDLTKKVNVEGTQLLLDVMAHANPVPRLIFTSSISIFGDTLALPPPRKVTDPIHPTDHYSQSKATCEDLIQKSGLKFVICRLSATPPVSMGGGEMDPYMFEMPVNLRVEYVHPGDVARALVNAISCDDAWGKTFLIGGGPRCQLMAKDFLGRLLDAIGIGALPDEAYGPGPYYLDWLDTTESQRMLKFQQVTYDDYVQSMVKGLGAKRYIIKLMRPMIRKKLLKSSKYWQAFQANQKEARK
ncbi:MAG: 3-beta hydroxysteroid dehydrogenase/isomerase family [Promethearchaeota archaeon CR_4]|nr:MAG: 3-beta hydroxysteroid dehydrogenase/isomerase family [Candidatus Lokiarchaeota archaeon CR_4]